jgi:Putative bacterial sensory transduction regulator
VHCALLASKGRDMEAGRIGLLAILIVASMGLLAVAQTEAVYYAADTQLLDQVFAEMEIDHEIELDDTGDPVWIFTRLGILITLAAYDEIAQGQYASLLFYASWASAEVVSTADVNGWNRASRFGRAYVDEIGDPAIELDLLLAGGVTARTIKEYIDIFVATASDLGVALGL